MVEGTIRCAVCPVLMVCLQHSANIRFREKHLMLLKGHFKFCYYIDHMLPCSTRLSRSVHVYILLMLGIYLQVRAAFITSLWDNQNLWNETIHVNF